MTFSSECHSTSSAGATSRTKRRSSTSTRSSKISSSPVVAFVPATARSESSFMLSPVAKFDSLIPSQALMSSNHKSSLKKKNQMIYNCDIRNDSIKNSALRMMMSNKDLNHCMDIHMSLIPSQSVNSRTKRITAATTSKIKTTTTPRTLSKSSLSHNGYYSDSNSLSSSSISLSSSSMSEQDDEAGDSMTMQNTKAKKTNDYSSNTITNTTASSRQKNQTNQESNSITKEANYTNHHKSSIHAKGGTNSTTSCQNIRRSRLLSFNSKHAKSYSTKRKQKSEFKHAFSYSGNLPDIHWRAIPMNHLRSHPNFQPLPKPKSITHISSLEDVRYFRQDSWQWDMLHSGRCTTSQAAPALGLLESNAAKLLGIPKSLQKGCMDAYVRLGQSALRTLDEMNANLCNHDDGGDDYYNEEDEEESEWYYHKGGTMTNQYPIKRKIWMRMPRNRYPFAAKYSPQVTREELRDRRQQTKKYMSTLSSPMRIRMNWGNSQEATAILTALNYFYSIDPYVKVKEVGMCGAGLKYNSTSSSSLETHHMSEGDEDDLGHDLILGASPDAVIEYKNGTLEVLEVKNHCPFVPAKNNNKNSTNTTTNSTKGRSGSDYRIREMPMYATVPPAYIPQLMMEMLCLGDECRSAVMCRQTATNGAILVRLRRDDEWINEMIYWLEKFVKDYVKKGTPPPRNFFWYTEDGIVCERYQRFVRRTKELSDKVELVEYVQHGSIQRVLGGRDVLLPLFLD